MAPKWRSRNRVRTRARPRWPRVDVKAHVEEAMARIMAAAGPPSATEAMEEGD